MGDDNPGSHLTKSTSEPTPEKKISLDSRLKQELIHTISSDADPEYIHDSLLQRLLSPSQYKQYIFDSRDDERRMKKTESLTYPDSKCGPSEESEHLSDQKKGKTRFACSLLSDIGPVSSNNTKQTVPITSKNKVDNFACSVLSDIGPVPSNSSTRSGQTTSKINFDNFACSVPSDIVPVTSNNSFQSYQSTTQIDVDKLFDRASQLVPHSVRDTLSLNNTRITIEALLKPLVSIVKTQMTNARLIRERELKIEEGAVTGTLLRDSLYVDQVFMEVIPLEQPQTVCTSERCVKCIPIGDTGKTINDYVTVCHNNCKQPVQVEKVPNQDLKDCSAMINGVCRNCDCSWDKHMHVTYRRIETVHKVMDRAVEESIRRKDDASRTVEIALNECRKNVENIMQEFIHIRRCCAEFTVFLSTNSITSYSDLFIIFIDHAIREEDAMVRRGKGRSLMSDLEDMKRDYENEVRFLKDSKMVRSVEEIDELISTLSQLKHCGSVIQDINKIRLNHLNQSFLLEEEIRLEKAVGQGAGRDRSQIKL